MVIADKLIEYNQSGYANYKTTNKLSAVYRTNNVRVPRAQGQFSQHQQSRRQRSEFSVTRLDNF